MKSQTRRKDQRTKRSWLLRLPPLLQILKTAASKAKVLFLKSLRPQASRAEHKIMMITKRKIKLHSKAKRNETTIKNLNNLSK